MSATKMDWPFHLLLKGTVFVICKVFNAEFFHYVFQRLGNMTFGYQLLNNSLSLAFKSAKLTSFPP